MKIMKMKMKIKMKMTKHLCYEMKMMMKMKMMKQLIKTKKNTIIKGVNDVLDKIIDKSKSFEDQIKSIRKVENLGEYYFINNYDDKKSKFKILKLRLAHLSNIIDEKIFKQIFGHKFETLANKLINTTNKDENQTTVNNINKTVKNY